MWLWFFVLAGGCFFLAKGNYSSGAGADAAAGKSRCCSSRLLSSLVFGIKSGN